MNEMFDTSTEKGLAASIGDMGVMLAVLAVVLTKAQFFILS